MITFENKVVKNLMISEGVHFTYADFALLTLNSPIRTGMTVKDIRERIALMDKFKVEKGSIVELIQLTKEDVILLQACEKTMVWGLVHDSIPIFSDYVQDLKETESK